MENHVYEQVQSSFRVNHLINQDVKRLTLCGRTPRELWGDRFFGPIDPQRRCFQCERVLNCLKWKDGRER